MRRARRRAQSLGSSATRRVAQLPILHSLGGEATPGDLFPPTLADQARAFAQITQSFAPRSTNRL
jgi:hypothetical protein